MKCSTLYVALEKASDGTGDTACRAELRLAMAFPVPSVQLTKILQYASPSVSSPWPCVGDCVCVAPARRGLPLALVAE